MARYKDHIGQVFERLTVKAYYGRDKRGQALWFCKCECGGWTFCRTKDLHSGNTRSCGCLFTEAHKKGNPKHKCCYLPEYKIFTGIIDRCFNPNNPAYRYYGGRGITICDEWRYDFCAFFVHIGPRPSMKYSVDRIDVNKGYEPGNVRWATDKQQANNKRNNRMITIDGITKTLKEWSEYSGV